MFFLRQSFALIFTGLKTSCIVGAFVLSSSDPSVFSWLFITDDVLKESDLAGLKDGVKLTSVILSPDGRCAEGFLNPAEVSASRELSVDDSRELYEGVPETWNRARNCYDMLRREL